MGATGRVPPRMRLSHNACAVTGGPRPVAVGFCNWFPYLGRIEPKNSSIGGFALLFNTAPLLYSIQLLFSIQYITHPSIQFSDSPLFNSATRLYSIQRLVSIQFRNLPLFNRKEKRDSGYTHGFATASIDIGGNGGICEQSRLVNNHKAADESSTYFHVTTHACSCVGRMPLPLGVMRAET